jgi:putative glutamine amidotransferase
MLAIDMSDQMRSSLRLEASEPADSAPLHFPGSRRPRIGLTAHREKVAGRRVVVVNEAYVDAVMMHGGMPIVLPPNPDPELDAAWLQQLDGLLIPGGGDVDPALYGQVPHPSTAASDPDLDEMEVLLIRLAMERDLPVLAICRGAQVLTVALGGSLIQHLPDQALGTRHEVRESGRDFPAHAISISPDSRLASIVGSTELPVNSLHHQGLQVIPEGLRAVAWAPDGLVEAVEVPGKSFVIGLQCHPEELWRSTTPEIGRLFTEFISAAAAYATVAY